MLIQNFNNLIGEQDFSSAAALIAKAKEQRYPGALIDYMEEQIKNSPRMLIRNSSAEKLIDNQLPLISPDNYLLYREDLRVMGFGTAQAEEHLMEYGLHELVEEEKSSQYKIRRYFDLNDSPLDEVALLLVHSGETSKADYNLDDLNGISIFHTRLDRLLVYVNELDSSLDIQEFAAWLNLRKKINYLCILDESDTPIDGWHTTLIPYLKINQAVIFSEEYVVANGEPRHSKRNRQYKSHPSQFRIFTRGYVSGIFAIQTALLSRLNTIRPFYANTWCLQVDITQQAKIIPFIVDIPLMVRNQAINPALLEYGDDSLRDHFRVAWNNFFVISKTNLGTGTLLNQRYPAQLEQGESGVLALKPNKDIKKILVSIIIPFRDKVELLKQCIESLLTHESLVSYEILLADNGSVETETKTYIESLPLLTSNKVSHFYINEPFNFSRLNNIVAKHASGDLILLLNNDIEFCAANPLSRMAAYFAIDQVGAVGATLLYPDLSIQHAGIVLTPLETYDTFCPYKSTREQEYDSFQISLKSTEEWSAATAACLLVRKDVWRALNGMDESLTVAYNDVDFCLRIRALGKSVISVPGLKIKHYESISRGEDNIGDKYNRLYKESGILRAKHPEFFSKLDPLWPKMLSVSNPRALASYHERPQVINHKCESGIKRRFFGLQDASHRHYCVYVGYEARSRIRPDVLEQIKILSDYYNIIFITTSHESISLDPLFSRLQEYTYKILIRSNIGYDFGSWRAGIMELKEEANELESLLLMNDSLYGPINSFEAVIEKTLSHEADIVCMTKNMVGGEHAQSYFVSYKKSVVASKLFQTFWETLPVFGCKFALIKECEIFWSRKLIEEGFSIAALFDTGCFGNQTHINWKELVQVHGFPFIKNELMLRNPVGQDLNEMPELLMTNHRLYQEMQSYWQGSNIMPLHFHQMTLER